MSGDQQVNVLGLHLFSFHRITLFTAHVQVEVLPQGAPGEGSSCFLHIPLSEIFALGPSLPFTVDYLLWAG